MWRELIGQASDSHLGASAERVVENALALAPMEPPDPTAATNWPATPRHLVLPPLLEAIDAWQAEPTAERQEDVAQALEGVARLMGLAVGRVRVHAPPLPELDIDLGGGTSGAEIALRVPGVTEPIGSARISGIPNRPRRWHTRWSAGSWPPKCAPRPNERRTS